MLDHLVYGVPDLEQGVQEIEGKTGVRPTPGGKHAGGLTHNALLSLGEGSYLEIIAPVPDVDTAPGALPFGLRSPRLVAWAVAADNLEQRVEAARVAGYDPGEVISGARDMPDGTTLSWRLAFPPETDQSIVPFLIQWASEPHPSATSAKGCRLVSLTAVHPELEKILARLRALSVDLPVTKGDEPRLIATLDTPNGIVELA
jgi:hypothetical protein